MVRPKHKLKYLKIPLNSSSSNELVRDVSQKPRELHNYHSNDLGTYVMTNTGWLFISKEDYVKDAGIHYYIRQTQKYFDQILNIPVVPYEGERDRSEFAHGELAFKTKTHKAKIAITVVIVAFICFEFLVLTMQYLDVAFQLSIYWHESIYWLIDAISFFNFTVTGGWYIAIIVLIAILNIPVLITILVLVWMKKIKLDMSSKLSTITLIILIFPFFMSFGIFSMPIMKLLLETYDCTRNHDGIRVLRRYQSLKCESLGQIMLFLIALITMLIQLVSSVVFLSITKEEGVFDENNILLDKKEKTDELNETEIFEDDESKTNDLGIFSLICRRKRFKKGVKYLPAVSFLVQVLILIICVYSSDDEWWPSFLCDFCLIFVIAYYVKRHPYADSRYNHWSIALYFNNFYAFFRTFMINTFHENSAIVKVATYGVFFTPFALILGYLVSILRGRCLKYDESDDYDEIDTQSDSKNKKNLKYANIIVDKMVELKLSSVKIQAIRIKYTNKHRCIAHGIFHCENDIGLSNASILLAHLCSDRMHKPIYFTKISFKNVQPVAEGREIVNQASVHAFSQLFYGSVFRYLTHLEFHNYIMFEENFFYIIALLKNSPSIELLNIENNYLVLPDNFFNQAERENMEESGNSLPNPYVYKIKNRDKNTSKTNLNSVDSTPSSKSEDSNRVYEGIWNYLKDCPNLRKVI